MAKVRCEICDRNFKNEEALGLHMKAKHAKKEEIQKNKPIPKKGIYTILVILAILIVGFLVFRPIFAPGNYDTFAQCITDSGAKMYGAYWCPHCTDQKEMFGKSWDKIEYIECSLPNRGGQNAECNAAGIESYPTWEFADGERLGGVLTFQELGQLTGCPVTADE